ncbi:MAG: hypothetical protein JOZ68_04720 [Acidimicrobiia bacterium]|nr:hypothetical protein [Acidimicrobiia bacterium]
MSDLITNEQLEALVAMVDAGVEGNGWNHGHLLLRLTSVDADGGDLGTKPIDGHPLDTLLGFTAPAEWQASGVSAEGWAASMDSAVRPSQSKGRMRVRTTTLVARSGAVASGVRMAGGELEQMGEGVGMVLDALKRALGLETAPPDVPFAGWVARMQLLYIIGEGPREHRRVPWCQLRSSLERHKELADEGSWETLRGLAAKRDNIVADLTPDIAAWMDEGMFSRWVIGGMPSYDHLLEETRRACTPEAFTQVRRQLRAWGLRAHVRRKAA